MTICGLSLHHGDTESHKSLEQKFITRWSYINSLLINPDKTRLLFLGVPQFLRSLPPLPLVMLSEQGIKPVPFTRDHITELASSCIFRLSRINRIKHLRDRKTVIFLINAFVFSKLFYCSTVWSNASKQNLNKLLSVKNFACRVISGVRKYDLITEGLKSLKWLSVKDKLLLNICTMVFRILTTKRQPIFVINSSDVLLFIIGMLRDVIPI